MAGQWLDDPPVQGEDRPHCMRAMLVANTDVQNAFANGATGRIVRWSPEFSPTDKPMKRCLANNPDLQVTFYQEDSYQSSKKHFLPEVDFMHIEPKKEVVAGARGKPSMLQLPFQPAYCLTIHKVQALTLRHVVDGCLEGMFALGQLYVLWSRVTDPNLFCAVGLPPADMLDDVAKAWRDDGQDVDSCFSEAVKVTGEWTYTPAAEGEDPCENVLSRLEPVHVEARRVPLRLSELRQILNPQPKAADVVHALLSWIHRADAASQAQESKPVFQREDGRAIFPPEELWWLTEFEKRKASEDNIGDLSGEIVPDEDLTRNPNEAGAADSTDESSMSEDEDFSGSDDGLPAGPSRRPARLKLSAQSFPGVSQDVFSCQNAGERKLRRVTGKKAGPQHPRLPSLSQFVQPLEQLRVLYYLQIRTSSMRVRHCWITGKRHTMLESMRRM